jgi:hypothetical protein
MKFLWILDLRNTSVFSLTENEVALKAAKTTSPLVQVPKGAERHFHSAFCGTVWVLEHSTVRGNEIADELAREGTVRQFVGPEPAWGSLGRI